MYSCAVVSVFWLSQEIVRISSTWTKTNTNLLHSRLIHSILRKIGQLIRIVVHQYVRKQFQHFNCISSTWIKTNTNSCTYLVYNTVVRLCSIPRGLGDKQSPNKLYVGTITVKTHIVTKEVVGLLLGELVSTKIIAHCRRGCGWLEVVSIVRKKNTSSQRMWLAYN